MVQVGTLDTRDRVSVSEGGTEGKKDLSAGTRNLLSGCKHNPSLPMTSPHRPPTIDRLGTIPYPTMQPSATAPVSKSKFTSRRSRSGAPTTSEPRIHFGAEYQNRLGHNISRYIQRTTKRLEQLRLHALCKASMYSAGQWLFHDASQKHGPV